MSDERGKRWLMVLIIVVTAAWGVFGWLSYSLVEPYIAGTAVTIWVAVIMGFLSLCAIVFVVICLVALASAVVPKRREREAG